MLPVPDCPSCGQRGRPLYSGLRDTQTHLDGRWNLSTCPACRILWLDPRPEQHALAQLYSGEYYTHDQERDDWDVRLIDGRSLDTCSFSDRLQADLLGKYVGKALAPDGPLSNGLVAAVLWAFPHVRDVAGSRVGWLRPQPGARLLDVGCGRGDFLALMRLLGWDVQGVEPDAEACAAARERFTLPVFNGDLSDARLEPSSFDVVTSFHVIEHMERPFELIEKGLRLLKPGGRMLIVTPNSTGLGHRWFRSAFSDLQPPRHLVILTGDVLAREAVRRGARIVECRSTARRGHTVWVDSNDIRRHGHLTEAVSRFRKLLGVPFQVLQEAARLFYPMAGDEVVLVISPVEKQYAGLRT